MMNLKPVVAAVLAAACVGLAVADGIAYRLDNNGRLSLGDGIVLRMTAYPKGWAGGALETVGYEAPDARTGLVRWQLKKGAVRYGTGSTTALPLADGRTYVRMTAALEKDFPTEGLVCTAGFTEKQLVGGTFEDNRGARGVFPAKLGALFPYGGCPRRLSLGLSDAARTLTLDFPGGIFVSVQDDRKWCPSFTLRIRAAGDLLKAGTTYEVAFCLGGEKAALSYAEPCVIVAGEDWIPLDYRRAIVPGSAADFSHFAFRDGPAGKYGWLKAKDGQFVFEKRPDEHQRFWGANFCGGATCPSHADAERIVTFFERAGYNTMRIHHYESTLVEGSADRVTPNPKALDRFDYFFAKAKERGIYTTTDLYVSRPVFWRDVGVDRDGKVDMHIAKGLFLVHEPAFENWKAFARNLLTHVNPYTGLRYADDPAMPFISLVNEGMFAWNRGIFDQDATRAAWKAWLAERRAKDPSFHPKAPADCLGRSIDDKDAWAAGLKDFQSDMEGRFVERAFAYLRSLGVKALLTDWNCGWYPNVALMTNRLDYLDTHYYVNHPSFLGERWALPVRVADSNPNQATREMGVGLGRLAYRAKKPYTISEWNFTAPNSCRGSVGLLAGGCAALLDWDAMWRFTYIGSGSELDETASGIGYFSILGDPFMTATERAGVLLYRRRELKPRAFASAKDYDFPIATEKDTGRFTVVTAATAGGFGLAGDTVAAGPLACRLGLSKATVWVSAVDDKPIVRSDRLLLTHLTDLKTDGIRFMDNTCTVLTDWGSRNLIVRRGTAEVSLALENPSSYEVWVLETNGARKEKLAARVADGRLAFAADVRGADGKARYLYEIVRAK